MAETQNEAPTIQYEIIRRDLESLTPIEDSDESDEVGKKLVKNLTSAHQLIESYLNYRNLDRRYCDQELLKSYLASPYIAASDALRKHRKIEINTEFQGYPRKVQEIPSTPQEPDPRSSYVRRIDKPVTNRLIRDPTFQLATRPEGAYPECVHQLLHVFSSCWPTIGVVVIGGICLGIYYGTNKEVANTLINQVSSTQSAKDFREIFDTALTVYLSAVAATIALAIVAHIVKCCKCLDWDADTASQESEDESCCSC